MDGMKMVIPLDLGAFGGGGGVATRMTHHQELVTDLLSKMVKTAETFNMDQGALGFLVLKIVLISLRYIDRQKLFVKLFPDQEADWDLILTELSEKNEKNPIGEADIWLQLLSFISWPGIGDKDQQLIDSTYPPLSETRVLLKKFKLDSPGWNNTCKVMILQMVLGLNTINVVDIFFNRLFQRPTTEPVVFFLASVSKLKFSSEQYSDAFEFILSRALVNEVPLSQNMVLLNEINAKREENRIRISFQNLVTLRPRLRDRLRSGFLTEDKKVRLDSQAGTWNSYGGFCQLHRFPSTLSENIKRKLYFLASQTRWDWKGYVDIIAKGFGDTVCSYPVQQPDISILHSVISDIKMNGRPSFDAMMKFRSQCFSSVPQTRVQGITRNEILRLYVAIYQPPDVWTDLWTTQFKCISPLIIRDCERFVESCPFDAAGFIPFLES